MGYNSSGLRERSRLRVEIRLTCRRPGARVREVRLASARCFDSGAIEAKSCQHINNILIFLWEIIRQNGGGVLPFMDLIVRSDEVWQLINGHFTVSHQHYKV